MVFTFKKCYIHSPKVFRIVIKLNVMKKNLYLAALLSVSLLAATVVSCKKEPAPDGSEKTAATVSVNIGSMYEELGISGLMAEAVTAAGGYTIIDSVLVYDAKGLLVTKTGVESNSLAKKEVELKGVPAGAYTLVLWQTVYSASSGVRAWKASDEESLSTVKVTSDGGSFRYVWALGLAAADVTLGDAPAKLEMTPKPAGSIVDVTVDNIPNEPAYTLISIVSGYHSTGIYLDPSRKDAPWIQSDFLGVLLKVSPGENGKGKFFSLLNGEDLTLWIRGDKADGYDDLEYIPHKTLAPGESYSAYFDMARSWQPAFFGSAADFAAWKADRDAGKLVLDPCLNWGAGLSEIEEYVHRKNWWYADNNGLYQSDVLWGKAFWVARNLKEAYLFETQDGRNLSEVIIYCDDTAVPEEEAEKILKEKGYKYVGEILFPGQERAYSYYVSGDNVSDAVIIDKFFSNWAIDFAPYDSSNLDLIVTQ